MLPTKPLTLRSPEVRELIATGKCEVRRKMKPQPDHFHRDIIGKPRPWRQEDWDRLIPQIGEAEIPCPLPAVGETVWIREAYAIHSECFEGQGVGYWIEYQADGTTSKFKWDGRVRPDFSPWWAKAANDGWQARKTMPQEASRLTATVTSLTAEQREGWEWVATVERKDR